MPQKKNPDALELVRGKTGRVTGALMAMTMTLQSLPLAYNKDLQEDKEGFFDTVDTIGSTLRAMAGMISAMEINTARMRHAAADKAPLQRNITVDEVAQTALFLCSGLSSGITGAIIPVDAGYHIMAV